MADGGLHPYDLRGRAETMAAEIGRALARNATRGGCLEVTLGGQVIAEARLGDEVLVNRDELEDGRLFARELEEQLRRFLAEIGLPNA